MRHRYLALLLFALLSVQAGAQNVRVSSSGFGVVYSRASRASYRLHRDDWPHLSYGDSGTQVHIHADYRNGDVTIITSKDLTQDQLLGDCRRIAQRLGLPKTDYILREAKFDEGVDMEFNKYLEFGRNSSAFRLDLSALGAALAECKNLPRPIVLCIAPLDSDMATLTSGHASQPLKDFYFLGLKEIPADSTLTFSSTLRWYAYPAAAMLIALLIFCISLPVFLVFRAFKMPKQTGLGEPVKKGPKTPEEVQAEYDRKKKWRMIPWPLLPIFFISMSGSGPGSLFHQGEMLLPNPGELVRWIPLLMVPALIALPISTVMRSRRKAKSDGRQGGSPSAASAAMLPLMLPMVILVLGLPTNFFGITDGPTRLAILFGSLAIGFTGFVIVSMRSRKGNVRELPEGDEFRTMAEEIGRSAGVNVRKVEVRQVPIVNAYATLFGSVGLTSRLLEEMEPDEIRAVIAHEIGHLKARHVWRGFVLSLGLTIGFIFLFNYGAKTLSNVLPGPLLNLLTGPLPFFFVLPILTSLILGPGRRKRELEADRFAVQVTGDPELVIRALTKLHTLNESPHSLRTTDELLSSHPSLVNRIKAIRAES